MKNLLGKVASVTGAASGIGRATAILLASEGCNLAISDVNRDELDKTAEKIKEYNVDVSTHILDVADKKGVADYADEVIKTHNKINIVINNAGVSLIENIDKMTYENFEWIMNINLWGVVYGTKSFLPYLQESNDGHIVNISSIFGIISIPSQSAYNASKFAVRGFTEALRMELELSEYNISATSVHPGGIKTNIVQNSRLENASGLFKNKEKAVKVFDKMSKTTSETAALSIINGIKKNKRRVLIGKDAKMLDRIQRVFPASYQKRFIKKSGSTVDRKNR